MSAARVSGLNLNRMKISPLYIVAGFVAIFAIAYIVYKKPAVQHVTQETEDGVEVETVAVV